MEKHRVVDELLKIKDDIERAKGVLAKLESKKEVLLERLQSEFGFDSYDAAVKGLSKLQKELEGLRKEVEAETEAFVKKYFGGKDESE